MGKELLGPKGYVCVIFLSPHELNDFSVVCLLRCWCPELCSSGFEKDD